MWLETLFALPPVRWAVAIAILCWGAVSLLLGNRYRGINSVCWVARVSGVRPLVRLATSAVLREIEGIRRSGVNQLLDSFQGNRRLTARAGRYSVSGRGSKDLFRDVIVLKQFRPTEKGVILLKYVQTFEAVASLFDVRRLMERYIFVLEPCWAGYMDPAILMYIATGQPVIVQCFTDDDFSFIASIGPPLFPVRLGPADWVDAEVFRPNPGARKRYDLAMVANWGAHKRHRILFRALRDVSRRPLRVLLIGFPWAGRTMDDVRREAASIQSESVVLDFVEQLPQHELAARLTQCKAFVFLSRKEGDNKALVEAMFSDVPAIVYDKSIGGAVSRINPATGVLAADDELAEKIEYMLDHFEQFAPRAWAVANTGSSKATAVLNEIVRRVVVEAGGRYTLGLTEKTNSPNLSYKEPDCRATFQADYDFMVSCLRGTTHA